MNSLLILLLAPVVGGGTGPAVTAAPTHAQAWDDLKAQVVEITDEYNDSYQAWLTDYRKAAPEAREELMEKMPDSMVVAEQVLGMVEDDPTSEAGFVASRWVIERIYEPKTKARAFDIMTLHTAHAEFGKVAQRVRGGDPAANAFLETAMEAIEDPTARGKICYRLATGCSSMLSRELSEQEQKETREAAEKYFAMCLELYADVVLYPSRDGNSENDITVASRVEHDLFELRNLTRGKVAPDIVGEDIDGVGFKLSDYRGKVVMLDFWGDW